MYWIIFTLCLTVLLHLVRPPVEIPECYYVKSFSLNQLTRRCLVRFKRTPESTFSIVSGFDVDELSIRAQCAMPSFVGSGCWSMH